MLSTSAANLKNKAKKTLEKLGFTISKTGDPYRLKVYKKLFDEQTLLKKPFYNIGAGSFWHPFWTNIDYVSDWYREIQKDVLHYDLMSLAPLPLKDASAKIFYTSHTVEHIKDSAAENLFREIYRALETNGIFRVTMPDAEADYRALLDNDADWFYWDEYYSKPGNYERIYSAPADSVSLAERWLHHFAAPLCRIDKSPSTRKFSEKEILDTVRQLGMEKSLDYFCSLCEFDPVRPGNHINWWSYKKIFSFLERAGFKKIYRSGYQQSVSPLMRRSPLYDSTHPQMSIYVEAIKSNES